jgi:anaerobic selenocysteine-containing dehydrogenase
MENGGFLNRMKNRAMKRFLGPERMLDLALRFGPHRLSLRKVKKAVHGIDLGPLTSCLPKRLRTADKHIELAPEVLVKDVERVKSKFPATAVHETNGELLLIGRRQLRSNNSWMHNSERLVKGKPLCTILMNPADAAHRELANGQNARVRSRVGSIVLPIEVSDDMMPGVVSIPHGWGHDRPGNQLEVAQQHPGQSINDLTDNQAIDTLCGTAAFSATAVTVEGSV